VKRDGLSHHLTPLFVTRTPKSVIRWGTYARGGGQKRRKRRRKGSEKCAKRPTGTDLSSGGSHRDSQRGTCTSRIGVKIPAPKPKKKKKKKKKTRTSPESRPHLFSGAGWAGAWGGKKGLGEARGEKGNRRGGEKAAKT